MALIICAALSVTTTASATYPGANGQLAYARYGGNDVPSTLRTIRPDGSPGRTLARPLLGLPDAEWSPDGTHVAMVVGKEPNRIVILDVHTDERSVVIRSEDVSDSRFIDSLGMSPDGQTLVFCSVRHDGTSLYTIGVDGSALTKISGSRQECQPDWGVTDRIAAEAFGSGSKIVTMEPDGTDRTILIAGRDADRAAIFSSPSWSPDGERLVVGSTSAQEGIPDLWIVDADGSNLTALTDTPRRTEYAPIFSPDGGRIAYLDVFPVIPGTYGMSDIFTMAVDGSDKQRLTDTPNRREFPRSWRAVSP